MSRDPNSTSATMRRRWTSSLPRRRSTPSSPMPAPKASPKPADPLVRALHFVKLAARGLEVLASEPATTPAEQRELLLDTVLAALTGARRAIDPS